MTKAKKNEIEADGFITPERYVRPSVDSQNKMGLAKQSGGIERYYNLNEASTLLGIKIRTAREWIHTHKMKAVKYENSTQWYVPESEIRRIQNGNNSREFTS